jgi:hypothetical protein
VQRLAGERSSWGAVEMTVFGGVRVGWGVVVRW